MANADSVLGGKKVDFGIRHRFKPQLSTGSSYLTFWTAFFSSEAAPVSLCCVSEVADGKDLMFFSQ